jgi:hypothetical protein
MIISKKINSLKSFLNRPFPEAENISIYTRTMFIISIFVTLFLGILQPFNMDQINGNVWKHSLIFGTITFVSGMSYEVIFRYIFKIKKEGKSYTLIVWTIQVVGLILFISFFNFLFLAYEFGMPLNGVINMIWATFLVGLFPTVFIGTISMIKSEKRNSEIANSLNNKTIKPEHIINKISIYDIQSNNIWFIESLQNYVNIYYWNGEEIVKKTERATLKSCENLIVNTNLIKCHRSFIVNSSKIENVTGNAQGLKLKLQDHETKVPVSRSFIPLFKA